MQVGVLGGLGPKATVYFMDMVVSCTKASCDQDHLDMIVMNHASIPDRTNFILGKSHNNPIPYLIKDAQALESLGCHFLVMPCNTSHFMYDTIQESIHIPLINMPREVAKIINADPKITKVGIMATTGTLQAKIYERYLTKQIYYPEEKVNNEVMNLIYNKVKKGAKVTKQEFYQVANEYFNNGCDIVIMGCTELSVIVRDNELYSDNRLIDSLKVLVDVTIDKAKKQNIGN